MLGKITPRIRIQMTPPPFSFSVTTMNLRFGLARDHGNRWECRRDTVRAFLDRHATDFMGFQEVNHFQADFLEEHLDSHGCIGRHNRRLPWWQSNMIFYRKDWTCLGFRHHFISPFPDIPSKLEGSRWPRQCVIGWFEKAGHQILAVNTHFDFTPAVQARSAGLVMDFLDHFPPGLPVVITGDFNADHGSSAFRTFRAFGFNEVFQGYPRGTFHGFTGETGGRHIDWILFRGGLRLRQPRVMIFHRDDQYPSDHFPVQADFFCPARTGFSPEEG